MHDLDIATETYILLGIMTINKILCKKKNIRSLLPNYETYF